MITAMTEVTGIDLSHRSGKVRDIFDFGDRLVMVATDRISAFDVVMANGIPDKGRVLNMLSAFWFDMLGCYIPTHMVSISQEDMPSEFQCEEFAGRTMLCRKATKVVPVECVVRGYITGSGWKSYQKDGTVCGISLPDGLQECEKLSVPIWTPTTKAESGHDEPMDFAGVASMLDQSTAAKLRDISILLYQEAAAYALERGIIIADTKFEFGLDDFGALMIIDEVFTPDSSRFWPLDGYEPGHGQPSYDKQFVRDWLQDLCDRGEWDKTSPGPQLPHDIITMTREKYVDAYEKLTGNKFSWV